MMPASEMTPASTDPQRHPNPWVDLLRGYVRQTTRVLADGGLPVEGSWLDPMNPRDATVVYRDVTGRRALVWDEQAGWRTGRFVFGRPGRRTVLADAAGIGGGVLPRPSEVAYRLTEGGTGVVVAGRTFGDTHDGLDDALRGYLS